MKENKMKKIDLKKLIKEEIDSIFKQYFIKEDDLLSGITFEELITAVQSNEQEINEQTVKKTFEEMVKSNLIDAKSLLRSNMKSILKELKRAKIKEINLNETEVDDDLEQAIRDNIIKSANKDYEQWIGKIGYEPRSFKWELLPGQKFIKLLRREAGGESVWGFIAVSDGELKGIPYVRGDVFRPASYQAPAKYARGNVFVPQNWKWTGPDYLKKGK